MLAATSTPNCAGIELRGDFLDFEALYDALHHVVGDEDANAGYKGARLRVLGICYDLRHALMGDRDIEFVENGWDADRSQRHGVIANQKNLYYKMQAYWPESLFVTMALNDFLLLNARKMSNNAFQPFLHKRTVWDASIAQVRLFQSEIVKCIQETVSEATFARMINQMHKDWPWMDGYITQYVDILNIRFLNMEMEQRQKSLGTMVKRMVERGTEYQSLRDDVLDSARHHKRSAEDIEIGLEYPEEFDW
jgi:hypothetical protein